MRNQSFEGGSIPEEHSFIIGDIVNQTMVVLGEDKTGLNEDINIRYGIQHVRYYVNEMFAVISNVL